MRNKIDKLRIVVAITNLVIILSVIILHVFGIIKANLLLVLSIIITIVEETLLFIFIEQDKKKRVVDISRVLGNTSKKAFDFGEVGIIVYDDEYNITWISEFLTSRNFNFIGERLPKALTGIGPLLKGTVEDIVLRIDSYDYQFIRCDDGDKAIFVKDVTEVKNLLQSYQNDKVVLGLISLDNYEETIRKEEEQKIGLINSNIRQRVVDWVSQFGGVIRRMRDDRFLVIINNEDFIKMTKDKFSILDEVKNESEKLNVNITASMCFAGGEIPIKEIDISLNSLMELVLSRGGDQVAVKEYGKEIAFYGASSEASEKTSKVRARVMANGLNGIVNESDKVFILPHNEADLDCLGSCLGIDKIIRSQGIDSYIIFNDIKVEPKTNSIYQEQLFELLEDHIFISPAQAKEMITQSSLLIVLDHHTANLSADKEIVGMAKKIAIVDHHRRMSEDNIPAIMIYNEPASSSTVELVSELMQYQKEEIKLTEIEASIMYSGILVDTDNLRIRCSARTFEACARLRKQGGDVTLANEWLADDYNNFKNFVAINKYARLVNDNIMVAAIEDKNKFFNRATLAKAADFMCNIKEVEAAFIIGYIGINECAISARSHGKINVQIIMEKLGGGGHFAASGLQKANTSVKELEKSLLDAIETINQGGKNDEGNSID